MRQIGVGHFKTTPKMYALVKEVLDTGRITYGPMSQALERRFAALHGSKYAIVSNSGTSSLQVALQALKELHGWPDGAKVAIPSLTFVATVNVALHNRLTPVLVDIEPDYYGINTSHLESLARRDKGVVAVMPVHLFGQPCNMFEVQQIASQYGLKTVEDSCETMFVSHRGKVTGSWGDISAFSTYAAHVIPTGVGGFSVTNNPDYAVVMRSLVNHGRNDAYLNIDDDDGLENAALQAMIARRFLFERVGHSFRISEFEAALGLAQLDDWQDAVKARRRNASTLSFLLSDLTPYLQLPSTRPHTGHCFMMYPIVCREGIDRDALCLHLEQRGIETRYMLPLTNQPVYRDWCNEADYPVAQNINQQGFYIASHPGLEMEDLEYIAQSLQEFLQRRAAPRPQILEVA